MIKKQYNRWNMGFAPCYFDNFIAANDLEDSIEDKLLPYKATLGKSKNKHSKLNVKWQDTDLYMMFVLKWS